MTRDDVRRLFDHMEWADSVIWNAARATDAVWQDDLVLERLHHIHLVQRIYLHMWIGRPDRGRELASFADISEVQDWARDHYRDLRAFLETVDESALRGPVEFPWKEELVKWFGAVRPATVEETMLQVALHSSHHRGQLCTMIRQHGGEPPLVDFVGWIWMGKPEAAWPARVTT